MEDLALWNLTREAWGALVACFEPEIESLIQESGVDDRAWGVLLAALTFEPEHITPAHLMVRGPYTAAEQYLARLRSCSEKGYLKEVAQGEFRLMAKGRTEAGRFIARARTAMAEADRLSSVDSQKLASLLERLVKTSLETPPPPDTWSICLSYQLMPAFDPPYPYFEQAVSCLAAYRDDAHLEAWRRTGLTATALEVLTYLWRDQVGSLAGLVDKLAHRGHSREVYASALAELREGKLISGTISAIRLTEAGKTFREQIEADTDRLFFAPWSCLSLAERTDLEGLLVRVRDSLRETVSQ